MKNYIKIYFFISIFLACLSFNLYSSGHGGVSGVQQRISIDARFMSLADAYDAISYDSSSTYFNSGGLVNIANPVLFVSYMPVWDNLTHIFFLGTGFRTEYLPVGIGIVNMGSTGIKVRSDSPEVDSLMDYKDISLFVSSAYEILPAFSVGLRTGFYYQSILNYNDWGIGLDISFLWRAKNPYEFTKSKVMRILQPISFGIIFYNILPPTINLCYKNVSFPLMIKNSITYRFKTLWKVVNPELGIGMEFIPAAKSFNFNIGTEFILWRCFYIRSGYKITEKIFTIGTGVDMMNITVDYGITPLSGGFNFYTLNLKIEF